MVYPRYSGIAMLMRLPHVTSTRELDVATPELDVAQRGRPALSGAVRALEGRRRAGGVQAARERGVAPAPCAQLSPRSAPASHGGRGSPTGRATASRPA